jgi:hypothetical protein
MKKSLVVLTGLFFLLLWTGAANAELIKIGTANYNGSNYNLIWDPDNNGNSVVWLDYTNSSTSWSGQNEWADGLYSALNTNLYTDYNVTWEENIPWRLPSIIEMNHLYSQDKSFFAELSRTYYWTSDEHGKYSSDPYYAYWFRMDTGNDGYSPKSKFNRGIALRTTQVTVVPEPTTMLLFGVGLLGIAGIGRRRKLTQLAA